MRRGSAHHGRREVDYENIPWRSTGFDEEALTTAVATRERATNILERQVLETNPIAAWTVPGAMTGDVLFSYEAGVFRYIQDVPDRLRAGFQQLVRELVDWRLAEYFSRSAGTGEASGSFVMKVSHTNGRPILFLPDRASSPSIPVGWQTVIVDGRPHQARFVKVAANVVGEPGSETNVLPAMLCGRFGPDAGLPGTDYHVACEPGDDGWMPTPVHDRLLRALTSPGAAN